MCVCVTVLHPSVNVAGALEPVHGQHNKNLPHAFLPGGTSGSEERPLLTARPHDLVLGPQPHTQPWQRAAHPLHVLWFKKQPHHRVCEMERFGGVPTPRTKVLLMGTSAESNSTNFLPSP